MTAFFSAAREAHTTLNCPHCGGKLDIRRTCHEASMFCPACSRQFPLAEFISQMDEAMENFLERLFVDRI